jgi:hypothetical protein
MGFFWTLVETEMELLCMEEVPSPLPCLHFPSQPHCGWVQARLPWHCFLQQLPAALLLSLPLDTEGLEWLSQLFFSHLRAPLNLLLKLALWYLQVCLPSSESPGVAPLITFALSSLWLVLRTAGKCVEPLCV